MKNSWDQLRWGSAQAGVSLSLASSGWLLSGLTPSPLVNSLLPALTTLPALLPLKRRAGAFCWIVCSAVALLLICSPLASAVPTQLLVIAVLMAGLIIALGQDMSQLPLPLQLLRAPELNFPQLRRASDIGALADPIRHGENGHRVPAGDAGALARVLEQLSDQHPHPQPLLSFQNGRAALHQELRDRYQDILAS